jgi:uncharacterized protein
VNGFALPRPIAIYAKHCHLPRSSSPLAKPSSPCLKICVVDHGAGICRGCHRTLAEIAAWSGMSEEARKAIMAELPARGALAPERC